MGLLKLVFCGVMFIVLAFNAKAEPLAPKANPITSKTKPITSKAKPLTSKTVQLASNNKATKLIYYHTPKAPKKLTRYLRDFQATTQASQFSACRPAFKKSYKKIQKLWPAKKLKPTTAQSHTHLKPDSTYIKPNRLHKELTAFLLYKSMQCLLRDKNLNYHAKQKHLDQLISTANSIGLIGLISSARSSSSARMAGSTRSTSSARSAGSSSSFFLAQSLVQKIYTQLLQHIQSLKPVLVADRSKKAANNKSPKKAQQQKNQKQKTRQKNKTPAYQQLFRRAQKLFNREKYKQVPPLVRQALRNHKQARQQQARKQQPSAQGSNPTRTQQRQQLLFSRPKAFMLAAQAYWYQGHYDRARKNFEVILNWPTALSTSQLVSPHSASASSTQVLPSKASSVQQMKWIQFFKNLKAKKTTEQALFRLALLELRVKNYTRAQILFQKYLSTFKNGFYKMQALYWLWHTNKILKQPYDQLKVQLVQDYPLTYYGLQARLDMHSLPIDPPPAIKAHAHHRQVDKQTPATFPANTLPRAYLPITYALGWQVFQALAVAEWSREARYITQLWSVASVPETIFRIKALNFIAVHAQVMKQLHALFNDDPGLISLESLNLAYPRPYKRSVKKWASKHQYSPVLLWAIARQESAFHTEAVSPRGALGLMQLMPGTARETHRWLGFPGRLKLPDDMFRPDLNIRFGAHYIKRMLRAFDGHSLLALAAFNVGIGNMRKWLNARTETKNLQHTEHWLSCRFAAGLTKSARRLRSKLSCNKPSDSQASTDVAGAQDFVVHNLWIDEVPWSETSFYVKAVARNFILYTHFL